MKDSGGVQYFLTDHLGSVVATTNASGTLTSQQRYLPFGGARTDVTSPNASPTDFTYTGQRDLPGTGLMDYKARFYSPYINRFLQPDSIIPSPANPQSWNRYSYVTNRPIVANDPTGHRPCDDVDEQGNCIDNEQRNKRLQKDLDRFVPPEKVDWDEMKKVGIGKRVQLLTPGEYDMFFIMKLRTHDGLDTLSLAKMYFILNNATDTTFELFSHVSEDGHNDPADAFRHAYWNALIARDMGADFAKQFTTAHETRPDSVREEAFMDLHNNQIGIDIALANPNATDAELQSAVLDSLYNGDLYIWDESNIYFSDQCPDCWWRAK